MSEDTQKVAVIQKFFELRSQYQTLRSQLSELNRREVEAGAEVESMRKYVLDAIPRGTSIVVGNKVVSHSNNGYLEVTTLA